MVSTNPDGIQGGSPIGSDEIKDGDDHCNEGGGESRSLRKVGETSGPLANSQRSVVRALHLLEELVDETEMGGTAGLMSHGARVRGSKVSLRFDNKVRAMCRVACVTCVAFVACVTCNVYHV